MKALRIAILLLLFVHCGEKHPRAILLVPIGAVPTDVLTHLQKELPALIQREVRIGTAIAIPPAALDRKRNQVLGETLLRELEKHDDPSVDRIVGIVDADAYAPGLNFIFGQARKPGRFAIVALPRLHDSFRGRPDNLPRFHERALKVTTHELGHTFDFAHCPNRKCVMHFANSVFELDATGRAYCEREQIPPVR